MPFEHMKFSVIYHRGHYAFIFTTEATMAFIFYHSGSQWSQWFFIMGHGGSTEYTMP